MMKSKAILLYVFWGSLLVAPLCIVGADKKETISSPDKLSRRGSISIAIEEAQEQPVSSVFTDVLEFPDDDEISDQVFWQLIKGISALFGGPIT